MSSPFEIPFDGAVIRGEADGFGYPVVFLHSGVTDRRMWADQMQMLAEEGYHVISYDRRGYGETTTEDVPFNHLVDLEAVLDRPVVVLMPDGTEVMTDDDGEIE